MYKWLLNWLGKSVDTFDEEAGTVEWQCPKCKSLEKEADRNFTGVCSKCRTHCLTEEFVPKPKTVYEKVTESIFDLKEEFENGELYFKWCGNGEEGIGYDKIVTENMLLCRYEEGRLLRKVEKPVSWQEQISEEYNFAYVEKEDSFVQVGCTSSEDMILFAKRVLELSGE